MKRVFVLLLCGLVLGLPAAVVAQPPPIPTDFSGTVSIGGSPAPNGTTVQAKCDTYTSALVVTTAGRYQFLSVGPPSVAFLGRTIIFLVNGVQANETSVYEEGTSKILNLTVGGALVKPNLRPYTPSGWGAPIVPTHQQGSRTVGALYEGRETYLNWAILNTGPPDILVTFWTYIYLDGSPVCSVESNWLQGGWYRSWYDTCTVSPGAGWHWLSLSTDATNAVDESDETDNRYEQRFYWNPVATPTPTPTPVGLPQALAYGMSVMSVRDSLYTSSSTSLSKVKQAGFGWVETYLNWRSVEHTVRGSYYWDWADDIVNQSRYYNLIPVIRIYGKPMWAEEWYDPSPPPGTPKDLGNLMTALVSHMGNKVGGYIIFNEPNLSTEWDGHTPDAAGYMAFLKEAYTRAKAANPSAIVVSASLAPTNNIDSSAVDDRIFLQRMYDNGLRSYSDVVGVSGCGFASSPDDTSSSTDFNFSRVKQLHDIMVANGDASKQVWALEVGWLRDTTRDLGQFNWMKVSEDQRAQYLKRAYEKAYWEWPWMGLMFIWNLDFYRSANHASPEMAFFGLLDLDGSELPSYRAVKEMPKPPPPPPPGGGNRVTYKAGWNLVAGPPGTTFTQANRMLYTSQGGAGYDVLINSQGVTAGWAYWALFASDSTVTMNGTGSASYTTSLDPGQMKMVGNPSGTKTATVNAEIIYTYDPAGGYTMYSGSASLPVGRGAWVYSPSGGTVTVLVP